MADPMKIRANVVGDSTEVKVLMSHEMETGQRKDAQGNAIPAWFIQNVTVAHNGKTGAERAMGPGDREESVPVVQVQGRRQGRQDPDHLDRQQGRQANRRSAHQLSGRSCAAIVVRSIPVVALVLALATFAVRRARAAPSTRSRSIAPLCRTAIRPSSGKRAVQALWKEQRGPKNASLEQCDLGLGAGVVKGAYARAAAIFRRRRSRDGPRNAARLVHGDAAGLHARPMRRRARSAARTGRPTWRRYVAFVTSESRGIRMNVGAEPPEGAGGVPPRREDVLFPRRHARLRVRDLPRRGQPSGSGCRTCRTSRRRRARRRPTRPGPRIACRRASCARSSGG